MTHGNYRQITHAEVLADSIARDYTIVTTDSVIARMGGGHVMHIVAAPDFWTMDEPIGYSVDLIRPTWMYGSEGHLFPLEFIGRIVDDWTEALEAGLFTEDDDPFPECNDFIWAVPNRLSQYPKPDISSPWKLIRSFGWMDALRREAA